jgi:hypothetical protein
MITLSYPGYAQQSFQPQTTFNPVACCDLIFLIPWIIDAADGAIYKYDPATYTIQLKKDSSAH